MDLKQFIKEFEQPKKPDPLFSEEDKKKLAVFFLNTANQLILKSSRGTKSICMQPAHQSLYKLLMAHTNRSEDSKLDVNNGVALIGKYGTGKTIMLRTIKTIYAKFRLNHQYFTAFELVELYRLDNLNKTNDFKNLCDRKDLTIFIDELGDEPRKSMTYGNEESVMYRFLKIKLDQIEAGYDFKLYFTSNLTKEEICAIYGERIFSRLSAYVNMIFLDDAKFKDLRS